MQAPFALVFVNVTPCYLVEDCDQVAGALEETGKGKSPKCPERVADSEAREMAEKAQSCHATYVSSGVGLACAAPSFGRSLVAGCDQMVGAV